MNNYKELREACSVESLALGGKVFINPISLAELFSELDYLRGGAKKESKYSAEFEEAWDSYPTRPGNSKAAAYKAWLARLKAGANAEEMLSGTRKYAAYCASERTEQHFIKQAATFFGPGEHFSADWTVKRAPTDRRNPTPIEDARRNASEEAKRRLRGAPPDDGMTIDMVP